MFEIFICIAIPIIASGVVVWIINYLYNKEPTLDLKGHFKPKRHFFFEKCSRCGKNLNIIIGFGAKATIWLVMLIMTEIQNGIAKHAMMR